MDNTSLILSTISLITFLGILGHTAIVIKGEKDTYKKKRRLLSFHSFVFLIPSWWQESLSNSELIRFEKGEWFVQFTLHPYSLFPVAKDLSGLIQDKELIFDKGNTKILTPYFLRNRSEIKRGILEVVRIEGQATQYNDERVYYDMVLFKDHDTKKCLLCESRSSILAGIVEGPYFEEAIKNYYYGHVNQCFSGEKTRTLETKKC